MQSFTMHRNCRAAPEARVTKEVRSTHRRAQHAKRTLARAYNADEAPTLTGDWRSFRAMLVASEKEWSANTSQTPEEMQLPEPVRASDANMHLLSIQDPQLAQEGVWAHPTPGLEQGCILLATPPGPIVLQDEALEQAVVFLVSHGEQGSMGLLLNRPTSLLLGRQRGGLRFEIENGPPDLQDVFSESRVYCGGPVAQNVVHIMHPYKLENAVQIVPGLYLGGEAEAAQVVKAGGVSQQGFKFFSGALVWEPGQLEREIEAGCWYTAACSRSLILKETLQLPTPLWREVMLLMGGMYAEVAHETYEGDEVSGE